MCVWDKTLPLLTMFVRWGHNSYHHYSNSTTSQGRGPLDLLLWELSSLRLISRRPIDWPHQWSSMCSCHYLLLVEIMGKGTRGRTATNNQRIPWETWSLQPWKESLLTPHELPVSSSSQCVPLDEPVVVRGDESRQKAALCVVATHSVLSGVMLPVGKRPFSGTTASFKTNT